MWQSRFVLFFVVHGDVVWFVPSELVRLLLDFLFVLDISSHCFLLLIVSNTCRLGMSRFFVSNSVFLPIDDGNGMNSLP